MKHFSKPLILSASLLFGCSGAETQPAPAEGRPVAVRLATAHAESLATSYRASGTVRGRTTAILTSKTTGYVRSVDG